jgi:hypothetical protein
VHAVGEERAAAYRTCVLGCGWCRVWRVVCSLSRGVQHWVDSCSEVSESRRLFIGSAAFVLISVYRASISSSFRV